MSDDFKEMKRANLSLCMIVKNEADMLDDCLASVAEIADQIVVVDTGSEDNTVEIAKQYKAEVYHHKWENNFARARNQSLKYATGDWILWMDADERLRPQSKSELVELLQPPEKPVAYKVQIQNLQKDQKNYILSDGHRLFTNNKGIHFTGRIHEQISPSLKKLGGTIRDSNINFLHLGYSYTGAKEKQKNSRNRHLLKKMVREEPKNAYAHYTLGDFYALNNQHQKAISHYQTAYKLDQLPSDMTASLLNVLGEEFLEIGEYQQAENCIKKSLDIINMQVGGYYLLYKLAEQRDQTSLAIKNLKKVLHNNRQIKKNGKKLSNDVVIEENKIFHTIGNLYYQTHDFELAYEYLQKAFNENRTNNNCIRKLFYLALKFGQEYRLQDLLDQLAIFTTEDIDFLNRIATYMIKNGYYEQALNIYQRLRQLKPDDIAALKRMAGLHAKIGNWSKAESLVAKIQSIK